MASTSVIVTREDTGVQAGTYSYCSRPRPLPPRRKYRHSLDSSELEDEPIRYANLMYEKRVVRGNTYALHVLPWSSEPDPLELQKQQEAYRKALARRRAKEQLRTRTPDPVEGRRHVTVQTELYLEELADRIIEVDVECQTDEFLDRPATPLFIPAKTGRDVATQILEGELFDFDIEVRPMLEVLVGKTIEQALLEVMEEEELANLRGHQRAFLELRRAELAEVQRLEEQERRHREEKERRKRQQLQVLQKEKETSEKIAARAFAQRYLSDLIPSVFGNLRDSGYFFDPVERDVEVGFVPWFLDEVEETMEKRILGRIITDELLGQVVQTRLDNFEYGVPELPEDTDQPPNEETEPKSDAEAAVPEEKAEPEKAEPEKGVAQLEAESQLESSDHSGGSEQPEAPDQGKAVEEAEAKEQETPAVTE